MTRDIVILLGGFLTSLLLFLGTIGVSFEWFTKESIDAFVMLCCAGLALGVNLYAVWKNTYVSKKARKQKEVLKQKGLK
jgi:SPP1 family holin